MATTYTVVISVLCLVLPACSLQQLATAGPKREYADSDFVHVTSSHPLRYVAVRSTRSWRVPGIRSFIAVNESDAIEALNKQGAKYLEHYGYFPDEGQGELSAAVPGPQRGNARTALAPALAHK